VTVPTSVVPSPQLTIAAKLSAVLLVLVSLNVATVSVVASSSLIELNTAWLDYRCAMTATPKVVSPEPKPRPCRRFSL
jgi:hypothetical protein